MAKRLRWLIGALLAGAVAASGAGAVALDSPQGRFHADFPAAPTFAKISGKTARGTSFDEYKWSSQTKDGWFAVTTFVYGKTAPKDYDGPIASTVAAVKGTLAGKKSIQLGGVEGREIVIDVPPSARVRERLAWIGDSLYLIVFSGNSGAEAAPEVDAFLNSFHVLAAAAPAKGADIDAWARCMGQGGPSPAIKACTAIIDAGVELPDNLTYAYFYRGRAHAILKEGEAAAKDYAAALKIAPQLAHAHFGLGQIFKAREDWPHAAEEFAKAAASTSEDADVGEFTANSEGQFRANSLTEHGFALFKSGDLKQPLADYEAAAKLCPTCSAPERNKALLLEAQKKPTEAAAAADRAIALNPRSAPAFLIRGSLEAHLGRLEAAIADFSEAIRLYPAFPLAYKARAFTYARLGKTKEAADDDKTMTLMDKGSADALVPAAPPTGETAKAAAAPALEDAALTALFTAKTWEARQGPWLATLEFRGDGSFRQHAKDQSEGGKLETETDGAWAISRGQLCLYTNVGLCLTGHVAGGAIALTRADDGVLEYFGASAKLQDTKADAASSPIAEFPVEEVLLPGAPVAGKGGKTLLYYIHGFEGRARAHSPIPEYFVDQIRNELGWDVIDGNYPRSGVAQVARYEGSNYAAAGFVARRIKELKAQGYDRIVVGGQSWGGWTSLALATQPGLPLDGVILVVPACCGWKFGGANTDDPAFANNKLYFDQIIARVRYPTVGVFFSGDEYEPADRGKGAAETLMKNGVANLIINHPMGFSGHGSAWFPVFDYEFRGCIVAFLTAPKTTHCEERALGSGRDRDFRAILTASQFADLPTKTATLPDMIGRQFAVYPDGDLRKIVSADKTEVDGYGIGDSLLTSSFRDDIYCVRPRVKYSQPETTAESCSRLVKWSNGALLALDTQSGDVVQWWIERK